MITCPTPDSSVTTISLSLFLKTLARSQKSLQFFTLTNLLNVFIKVETYKNQADFTQCYNSQRFSHMWFHNSASLPKRSKGESQNPSKYQGCSCTKKELQRRKLLNTYSGRHLTLKTVPPGAAALANCVLERRRSDTCHQKNIAEQVPKNALKGIWWHKSPQSRPSCWSIENRHGRWQFCSHYESILWIDYADIGVTLLPIQSWSKISTPIHIWSLFPLGRRRQFESSATTSPMQTKPLSQNRTRCLDHRGWLRQSAAIQPVPLPMPMSPRNLRWWYL